MCGRFGTLLSFSGATDADNTNLAKHIASSCDSYGEPMPSTPVVIRARIAEPDDDIIAEGPSGLQSATCHACKHCIRHDVVHDAWNLPLPLCSARGELIFDPSSEAKGCPWATPGAPRTTVVNVNLLPHYVTGFKFASQEEVKRVVTLADAGDPANYVSDMPVEADDAADGIRAWRVVTCPFGTGRTIPLPIFDPSFFTEAERELIPSFGDAHHPELYMDYGNLLWRFAVESWQLGETLLIQSLPGLGKTEFTYWLAYLMQVPWTRIFFTDEIEWSDIFGKLSFTPERGVFWTDGRYTAARRRPGIITVDEPNLAKSEIVATLRTDTERTATLYLDAAVAETTEERQRLAVVSDPYNFRIWTANPAWDPRNIGTKELAAADISRLSPAVLEPPPEDIERLIIRNTVRTLDDVEIPEADLTDLLKVSSDLRQLSHDLEYPGTWGIRENIKVARKLAWYPFIEAFRMAALNYFEPETANMVIENSIKTIRGDDL